MSELATFNQWQIRSQIDLEKKQSREAEEQLKGD